MIHVYEVAASAEAVEPVAGPDTAWYPEHNEHG